MVVIGDEDQDSDTDSFHSLVLQHFLPIDRNSNEFRDPQAPSDCPVVPPDRSVVPAPPVAQNIPQAPSVRPLEDIHALTVSLFRAVQNNTLDDGIPPDLQFKYDHASTNQLKYSKAKVIHVQEFISTIALKGGRLPVFSGTQDASRRTMGKGLRSVRSSSWYQDSGEKSNTE